jgi:hypothetical protein
MPVGTAGSVVACDPGFLHGCSRRTRSQDVERGQIESVKGDESMRIRVALGSLIVGLMVIVIGLSPQRATAANEGQPSDWQRFYYYPYVYYPSNFQKPVQFDHMYYRYPPARQIPVYNTAWHNFYPEPHPWHQGAAFMLDVF